MANSALLPVKQWFHNNRLSLNISKTKALAFSLSRYDSSNLPPITIAHEHVELVTNARLLGIDFNAKLTWNFQVSNILAKLSGITAVLSKLRNTVSHTWLFKLYNAHFLPYLMYCCTIWESISKQLRNKLAVMQKRALKTILHVKWHTSSTWVFANSTVLSLEDIGDYQILIIMFKFLHGLFLAVLGNLFFVKSNVHIRQTRNMDAFNIPFLHLTLSSNTIFCRGPKLWNSLPPNLQQITSLPKFKLYLKHYFKAKYCNNLDT